MGIFLFNFHTFTLKLQKFFYFLLIFCAFSCVFIIRYVGVILTFKKTEQLLKKGAFDSSLIVAKKNNLLKMFGFT